MCTFAPDYANTNVEELDTDSLTNHHFAIYNNHTYYEIKFSNI